MEKLFMHGYQQEFIMTIILTFSVSNSNHNSPALLNKNNRLGVTFNGN